MWIHFDFGGFGLQEQIERLEADIDRQVLDGLDRAMGVAAQFARANHPYRNRTGNLQESTRATESFGSFLRGTLTGGMVADAESPHGEMYGSFVEEHPGLEFLEPAYDRATPNVERIIEEALSRAAR